MSNMDIRQVNSLVLAYIGDCVYENYIRHFLVVYGLASVDELQKNAVKYVSAKAQCEAVHKMLDNNFLTEEEINVFTRIRNNKGHGHPKNCDIVTYKWATGLEGLIGYLDLLNRKERIDEIMKYIVGE